MPANGRFQAGGPTAGAILTVDEQGAIRSLSPEAARLFGGDDGDLLDLLMETLPATTSFKARDSRFLRINKALADRFGLGDPAEAVGKTDFDFFTREHAQQAYDSEQEIIRTGQPVVN